MNSSAGVMFDDTGVTLYLGCMFSGKTSALIEFIYKNILRGRKCVIIRKDYDTRNADLATVNTHFGIVFDRCPVKSTKTIMSVEDLASFDVIGIDEGQFFDADDLCNFVNTYHNKTIVISALNGSWELKPFEPISRVIPYCENIIKLSAVCETCKQRADFSKKVVVGESKNKINDQIIIGGKESFIPACFRCLTSN